jgi:2',3'-cyclic-nucleotide 2'-phosphodiesterase (5'-nucleotidase family)
LLPAISDDAGNASEGVEVARHGTLRAVATTDLGGAFTPMRTSFGTAGTCAGVARLLERERASGPTVWLDAGDLLVGPLSRLLDERPWHDIATLPIAAAAVGNHEFDHGIGELRHADEIVPFPMLCANVDVGLPTTAMLDTPAGPLGVIGLTHPHCHQFSQAPAQLEDWPERVREHAADLRRHGARWVVAILHDGVDWWPDERDGRSVRHRAERLTSVSRDWVDQVDLVLGGHVPVDWSGSLNGVPAGHAGFFAATALLVDLEAPPAPPAIRGVVRVPPVRPPDRTPAVAALQVAEAEIVGHSRHTWLGRTGAEHYLPDLVARALQRATDADAGMAFAGQNATQNAVDGAISALPAGPVNRLDLLRLFPYPDDRPVVVELAPDELREVVLAHDAVTDPHNVDGDHTWWNWARMPAGVFTATERPRTVAVLPYIARRLERLLDRELGQTPATAGLLTTLTAILD